MNEARAIRRVGRRRTPTLDSTTPHGASTALLADLDRCQHTRHKGETCPECGGISQGNQFLVPAQRVGTDAHGYPIKVPNYHDMAMPGAWRENCDPEPLPISKNALQEEVEQLETMVARVADLFGGRPDVVASRGFLEIMSQIFDERLRQELKFGVQDHPDGTSEKHRELSDKKREANQKAFREGNPTFAKIATEEFFEVMAEEDPVKLRNELIQLAAVCVQWAQAIDRREKPEHNVVGFRGAYTRG